ncbi:MAG TPA: T9SS type A sorting domain-containing protein [Bacteroidia bacterium]|jgi:hypothetical protein|nr:T9SS type A sorting domain-containing protein [Bacteroidia bacterium]
MKAIFKILFILLWTNITLIAQPSLSLVGTYHAFGPTTNDIVISYSKNLSNSNYDVDSLTGFFGSGNYGYFYFNMQQDSMSFESPWGCSIWYAGYAIYSSDFDTINLYFNQYTHSMQTKVYAYHYEYVRISTSIDNLNNSTNHLCTYPSPCQDNLNCIIPTVINSDDIHISIYNELGELMAFKIINSNIFSNKLSINTSQFNPGVYVIVVSDGFSNYDGKFIKE